MPPRNSRFQSSFFDASTPKTFGSRGPSTNKRECQWRLASLTQWYRFYQQSQQHQQQRRSHSQFALSATAHNLHLRDLRHRHSWEFRTTSLHKERLRAVLWTTSHSLHRPKWGASIAFAGTHFAFSAGAGAGRAPFPESCPPSYPWNVLGYPSIWARLSPQCRQ